MTLTTSPADLERKLDDVVSAWLRDAEVRPDGVVLLTPRSIERSLLGRLDRVGGAQLTDDPWAKGKIVRSSIHRFKGLERLVVGLVELESVRHDVLYVGLSWHRGRWCCEALPGRDDCRVGRTLATIRLGATRTMTHEPLLRVTLSGPAAEMKGYLVVPYDAELAAT